MTMTNWNAHQTFAPWQTCPECGKRFREDEPGYCSPRCEDRAIAREEDEEVLAEVAQSQQKAHEQLFGAGGARGDLAAAAPESRPEHDCARAEGFNDCPCLQCVERRQEAAELSARLFLERGL
jgi:hypothetical protein